VNYIFYHQNCYDGFGAAWAAWQHFGDKGAKYIPLSYGTSQLSDIDLQKEDNVFFVDFSISNEDFEKLVDLVKTVTILDHHQTALDRFTDLSPYPGSTYELRRDNVYVLFDMNKSGALITWEYFHPNVPIPPLISYISDRDLWLFKYPQSKSIHALLSAMPMDFMQWTNISNKLYCSEEPVIHGNLLLDAQERTVSMICKKAYMTNISGYMVPIVNSTSHWSEVTNKLLDIYPYAPFAASYSDQPDGMRLYSLRSRADEDVDVAALALHFGGGGHVHAAGFKLPVTLQPIGLITLKEQSEEEK